MPALLCLGCGEDLTIRAADRRVLQGLPAERVVDAWKAVYENVQVDVDDDRLCADTHVMLYSTFNNIIIILCHLTLLLHTN